MRYIIALFSFLILLQINTHEARSGAAVCLTHTERVDNVGVGESITKIVDGNGYAAQNAIIAENTGLGSCWSSKYLEHGYFYVLATKFKQNESLYSPDSTKRRAFSAGFGETSAAAMSDALMNLRMNAVSITWSESDGYDVVKSGSF